MSFLPWKTFSEFSGFFLLSILGWGQDPAKVVSNNKYQQKNKPSLKLTWECQHLMPIFWQIQVKKPLISDLLHPQMHGSLRYLGLTSHSFLCWCVPLLPLRMSLMILLESHLLLCTEILPVNWEIFPSPSVFATSCSPSSSPLHHTPLYTPAGAQVRFLGKHLSPSDLPKR